MILSGPGSEASLLDLNGNGGWALVDDGGEWKNRERSADTGGPARQVLARPFLIVTATQGTPEAVQTLHDVAIYMSMGHAYASKTTSRIVNDTVMASELQSGGHLAEDYNLVVIGGPAYNKAASSLVSLSPMRGAKLNTGYGPGAPEGEHWLTLGPCKVELNIQIPYNRTFKSPYIPSPTTSMTYTLHPTHSAPHKSSRDPGSPQIYNPNLQVRGVDTAGLITSPRRLKRGGLALDLHLAGGSVEAISALIRYSFAVDQALTRYHAFRYSAFGIQDSGG